MELQKKSYLPHVNALRGLAIFLVVMYHFLEAWCPQGYLGVDAFFVISGFFLIPPLLNHEYRNRPFSWLAFYKGKFLRIMPPLVVVVLLTLLASTTIMIYPDLCSLGASACSTLVCGSNLHYGLRAVDYFATSVKDNPLLHSWYISVLVQLIIVAPIVCIPLSKLKPKWSYSVLALIAVLSLLLHFQLWLPKHWQELMPDIVRQGGSMGSTYYMTACRAWELIAGAFIAFLPGIGNKSARTLLLALGILLLVIPSFWMQAYSGWPLLAVLGTMLVIRYGGETHASTLFQNPPLMWLGTISYSLYLVHWPVLSLSQYIQLGHLTPLATLVGIAITLILSCLIYRYVEKSKWKMWVVILLWVIAAGASAVTLRTQGFYGLHPLTQVKGEPFWEYKEWKPAADTAWIREYPKVLDPIWLHLVPSGQQAPGTPNDITRAVQLGDSSRPPRFALIGDSYAASLFPGFDIIASQNGWSGLYLNLYATPFWGRTNTEYGVIAGHFTKPKAEALMQWLSRNPDIRYIIVAQRWNLRLLPAETWDGKAIPPDKALAYSEDSLKQFCTRIKAMGKEIILILPTPELAIPGQWSLQFWKTRARMWYQTSAGTVALTQSQDDYNRLNKNSLDILYRLKKENYCHLLDPVPVLFQDGNFDPEEGNNLILWDHGHLSIYGATKLMKGLAPQITPYLGTGKQEK